jgi:hypothetical protein
VDIYPARLPNIRLLTRAALFNARGSVYVVADGRAVERRRREMYMLPYAKKGRSWDLPFGNYQSANYGLGAGAALAISSSMAVVTDLGRSIG